MAQHHLKLTPKWIIFLLDLSCCIAAMALAFLLRFNFHAFHVLESFKIWDILLITVSINACILLAFKTYAGIIRYTSLEDTSRIMSVNIIATLVLFIIQQIYPRDIISGYSLIPMSILGIYFICVNFIMILYRILVRKLFQEFFAVRRKRVRAILYSAGLEGILAKRMFTDNQRSDIKIIAIVEDAIKMIGKIVENTTVSKASRANLARFKKDGAELLIIADPFIKRDRLNELVDICLELNIRVLQVPPSEKWINNKLDVKQLKNIKIEQLLEREVIHIENQKIGEDIKGKTILVTGAAGSIGSEITRIVLKYEPAMVIALDNAETPLHALKLSLSEYKNIKTFIGDITDKNRMEQIFEVYAPNLIYHAAAYKHVPIMEEHPSIAVINNVYGTKLLAEMAVLYGTEKFVMVSTDKAVNPTNVMGASKRIAEIFTQSLNSFNKSKEQQVFGQLDYPINATKFITTRFGNVLGSNGSVIPIFKKQIEVGGPITITHPDITRYFMTIPEACQLVIEAGSMGNGGEIFVFDMGKPVKIVDLARKMVSLSGKTPDLDIKITFTGLRQGEKLYEELLNNSENTMPTYHNKILIAKVREYDFDMVVNQVNELIRLANKHLAMETVTKMKEIVPEFISNNSIFQKLDKST